MTSAKKALMNEVVIPTVQAGIFSLVGAGAGHYASLLTGVKADVLIPGGALLFGGWWLAKRFDKGSRFPARAARVSNFLVRVFGFTTDSLPSHYPPDEGIGTTILLRSNGGTPGWGEWYRIPGISPLIMRRIAFHVCFMGGRLSHDYLDVKTGMLGRGGVIKLQRGLHDNKLAIWRNEQRPNRGIQLTERGADVLLSLARTYKPTLPEKQQAAPFLKNWCVTYMHEAYIRQPGGGVYN